jgi:hypothetical protein
MKTTVELDALELEVLSEADSARVNGGLTTGEIVGISLGSALGAITVVGAVWWIVKGGHTGWFH